MLQILTKKNSFTLIRSIAKRDYIIKRVLHNAVFQQQIPCGKETSYCSLDIVLYLWQPGGLHERRQPGTIPRIRLSAEGQQQFHALQIQRRHEINLGAEEVPLVRIRAGFEQGPRDLHVTISQGQT